MVSQKHVIRGLVVFFGCFAVGCAPPLALLPTELPNGAVALAYSVTLTSDAQGTQTWKLWAGSLPTGLTLDETTGVLSGTPTVEGTFNFTITATEAGLLLRQGQQAYVVTIQPQLTLDASLDAARVDQSYSDTFAASGGVPPYTFQLIGLPAGVALDKSTGTVAGTPLTINAAIQLQITVTDSGDPQQSVTESTSLTVKPPAVEIMTTTLADGTVHQDYSAQVEATNGIEPYHWSVSDGVLPKGSPQVRLHEDTGVISGKPIESGTFTITITVTDSDSPDKMTDSKQFTIEISP